MASPAARQSAIDRGYTPEQVDAFITQEGGDRTSDDRVLSAFSAKDGSGGGAGSPGLGSATGSAAGFGGLAPASAMPGAADPALQGFESAMAAPQDTGTTFAGPSGSALNPRLGTRSAGPLLGLQQAGVRY